MHNKVSVSVLVPICNMERYLRQCLDSLAAQTCASMEILCLDDGSTDASPEIIAEYIARDGRFRTVRKGNSGYGDTLNFGLELAVGEYVGIVESDDFIEPDMFEALYALATEKGCDIARGNRYDHVDGRDTFKEVLKGFEYGRVFSPLDDPQIFKPAPCIWAQIYRREFLDSNGIRFLPTPGASYQDTGFVYKSYIAADRIVLTPEAHVHYRKDNPGSSVKSSSKVFCVVDEFHSIDEFLDSRPERRRHLAPALAAKRFSAYRWNLKRLGWKDKRSFLVATADELRAIDESVWEQAPLSAKNRRVLNKWMEDPVGLWLDMRVDASRSKGHEPGRYALMARRAVRGLQGSAQGHDRICPIDECGGLQRQQLLDRS